MNQKNLKKKKKKSSQDLEIISGLNPVCEVLKAEKRKIEKIWIAAKTHDGEADRIFSMADKRGIPVVKTSREEIFRLSRIEKNQGIIATVEPYKYSSLEDILENGRSGSGGHFILILDNILDPQNLGSIIRTAHLTGVDGVIIPERNSAQIGPAATRASAGAVEYVPIARVTNITRTLKILKEQGIWIVGVEIGGKSLYSQELSGSYAFVMGSEGRGMRRLVKEECDFHLTIPMNPLEPGVNSYNVSVATAILLSEVNRQRHYKSG